MAYTKEWSEQIGSLYNSVHTYPDGSMETLAGTSLRTYPQYRSGQRVEKHAALIAKLQDASSNFETSRTGRYSMSPFTARMRTGFNPDYHYYNVNWGMTTTSPPSMDETLPSGLDTEAQRRLYSSLGKAMAEVKSLPFIGELREARKMVKDRAQQLLRSVTDGGRSLKRLTADLKRSGKSWRYATNSLSQHFLELQFGWRPLVGDISSAVSVFRNPHPGPYVRGIASKDRTPLLSTTFHSFGAIAWHVDSRMTRNFLVKYIYRLSVSPSVNSRLGFSWSELPGACWELTPWSFLVDYFLDIQGFLTSQVYGSTSTIYGCRSTRVEFLNTYTALADTADHWSMGRSESFAVHYTRTKQSSWPVYIPTLNLLGPLEGLRGLNVAALLGCRVRAYN